jgi:hypothetical protein
MQKNALQNPFLPWIIIAPVLIVAIVMPTNPHTVVVLAAAKCSCC